MTLSSPSEKCSREGEVQGPTPSPPVCSHCKSTYAHPLSTLSTNQLLFTLGLLPANQLMLLPCLSSLQISLSLPSGSPQSFIANHLMLTLSTLPENLLILTLCLSSLQTNLYSISPLQAASPSFYEFSAKDIDGNEVSMEKYK